MVSRPMWNPWRRKARHNFRSDLCVHFNSFIGSPAVASCISLSSAVRRAVSFFFEPHSPSSLVANAVLQIRRGPKQLPLATSDGIPAQPCNPGEFGNATTTLLSGEEGDIESAALFVESSDQLVNQSMLFGNRTLGTTVTVRTTTVMNYFCHETHPSAISKMRARLL